jgi:hypothetical protein
VLFRLPAKSRQNTHMWALNSKAGRIGSGGRDRTADFGVMNPWPSQSVSSHSSHNWISRDVIGLNQNQIATAYHENERIFLPLGLNLKAE